MMEMTIKVSGLEGLEAALNRLADAVAGTRTTGAAPAAEPTAAPVQQIPVGAGMTPPPYQPAPLAPIHAPQPPLQQYQPPTIQSAVPQPQMVPVVPTSHVAQAYTQEQMAVAMTSLVDAGKLLVVQALLQQFGVVSLMEISPDRYAELAVRLREAGATI